MKLTPEQRNGFDGIFNNFLAQTEVIAKTQLISDLGKEDLEKFTFHLYNEAYKYSEDLKSGGYVPTRRLRITRDQLKTTAPYLFCAKVKNITDVLSEDSDSSHITQAIKKEFKIQENEFDAEKLNALVEAIKQFKDAQKDLRSSGDPEVFNEAVPKLAEVGFWEKYFLWLIHLFVEKTAREIKNEKAQYTYNARLAQHKVQAQASQSEKHSTTRRKKPSKD